MSFSNEWEQTYRKGSQLSVWPWSDLVSLVMRHARPNDDSFKVLELGCGAGANIRFFLELKADYYGIEGSPYIVTQLKESFPQLNQKLVAADFTDEIVFQGPFDLIVDRSSITHNPTINIERCLNLVFEKMKPGAKFIGVDWFSTTHSDRTKGSLTDDEFTYTNFTEGQFKGVGKVHFSDEAHLRKLFKKFSILHLEHKTAERIVPNTGLKFASWNIVAEKI